MQLLILISQNSINRFQSSWRNQHKSEHSEVEMWLSNQQCITIASEWNTRLPHMIASTKKIEDKMQMNMPYARHIYVQQCEPTTKHFHMTLCLFFLVFAVVIIKNILKNVQFKGQFCDRDASCFLMWPQCILKGASNSLLIDRYVLAICTITI